MPARGSSPLVPALAFISLVAAGAMQAQSVAPPSAPPPVSAPQNGASAPLPAFRSGVELVALNVSVIQADGRPIPGLPRDAFSVYEDGVAQDITFFEADACPLAVAILLDTSVSMADKLAKAQDAAVAFLGHLREGDVAAVLTFNDHVEVATHFTDDREQLAAAMRNARARGGTMLYDAVAAAVASLRALPPPSKHALYRKMIVLLSDGENTAGTVTFEEALQRAQQADATIYTISLREEDAVPVRRRQFTRGWYSEARFALGRLAQDTGGRRLELTSAKDLEAAYAAIGREVSALYTIGYVPKNPVRNGAWRRIVVRLSEAMLRVRTRTGYLARPP